MEAGATAGNRSELGSRTEVGQRQGWWGMGGDGRAASIAIGRKVYEAHWRSEEAVPVAAGVDAGK